MRRCEESSDALSTVPYSALLVEQEKLESLREELTLESQFVLGLATEAKELREKMAEYEKVDAAAKSVFARTVCKYEPLLRIDRWSLLRLSQTL